MLLIKGMRYFILAMHKIVLLLFWCFGFVLSSFAQQRTAQEALNILLDLESNHKLHIGVSLMNLDSGEQLLENKSDGLFIPGSTLKVITGFSVLDILGEDFKFKTPIQYTGEILEDGNLTGDLIISGSGDPTLGSVKNTKLKRLQDLFDLIALRVKKAGITCIDGDLIIDASEYGSDAVPASWFWEDIGNYYGAGAWSLNIHENYYSVYLKRSLQEGVKVNVDHLSPYIPGLYLRSNLTTAAANSGDQAYIFGGPYNYFKDIRGTIPIGENNFRIKGAMPEPPRFFGQALAAAMEMEGISFRNLKVEYEKRATGKRITISNMVSPSLGQIVKTLHFDSNNLYAEALLKKIGAGDRERGVETIQKIVAGGNKNFYWKQVDGSGLSVLNKISPSHLSTFLYFQTSKHGVDYMTKYLPRAGKEGTVRYLLKNHKSKGHVWLKSGSMKDVQCYTGIIEAKHGQHYALTILVNGDIKSERILRTHIESFMESIYLQDK